MSSHASRIGGMGLVPLFSLLVLFLSLFNLAGAAPLPAPDDQPAPVTNAGDWGDVFPFDMSVEQALVALKDEADTPQDATDAEATIKDELTKAKAGQPSELTDSFFDFIQANPEGYLGSLDEMAKGEEPTDPIMAAAMQNLFGGEQVDTDNIPGGYLYDASNEGAAVSDDSNNVKKANPGLADRFSLFGKSKQLVRWTAAKWRAIKGRVLAAKAANKPMTKDDQTQSVQTFKAAEAQTKDAAVQSFAAQPDGSEGKPFVIVHEPEGGSIFEQTVRPAIVKLAADNQQFHPAALPKGDTKLMDGLKLDTTTSKFTVKITDAQDPAAHLESSGSIQGPNTPTTSPTEPQDPVSPVSPVDPNAPLSPISPTEPNDPNAPTNPDDPSTTKPKNPTKPQPVRPPPKA